MRAACLGYTQAQIGAQSIVLSAWRQNRGNEMSWDHNMNLYGDGTVYRGERSADSEEPTIDWQSSCEMWKAAHERVDRIANELQDTVHKQANEIEPLREAVKSLQRENQELYEALQHPSYDEENRLRAGLEEWRSIFGHLGTPDEVGNEWHKLTDRLEAAEKERDNLRAEVIYWREQTRKLRAEIEAAHSLLDNDESKIIRNAKDGYPEGREPKELTLTERVAALCKYAADWARWLSEAESKIAAMKQQEPAAWTTQLALELGSSALGFDACRGNLWGDKGVPLYALPGAQPDQGVHVEQDESVRKACVRFRNELHRSPDAPYPGMSEAFEQHFSQSFTDRAWRAESGTWAAAWKAAKRHGAQPAQSVPVAALNPVIDWLRNGCDPQEAAKELELLIAAAPEAKL